MMTFFGVNFYLSGLHSYASGDRQSHQIPCFIHRVFRCFGLLHGLNESFIKLRNNFVDLKEVMFHKYIKLYCQYYHLHGRYMNLFRDILKMGLPSSYW